MVSAIFRKSLADLGKRRSRTFFTILTIALSVSALGLFSVMPLMNGAMTDEISDSNLYDVQLRMNDLELTTADVKALESIDNVRSVELKSVYSTRMYIGERRNEAVLVGVMDFYDQSVDVVKKDSGNHPSGAGMLTDVGNGRTSLYEGHEGDIARIYDSTGKVRDVGITGKGHCLPYSDLPTWGTAVFYTSVGFVNSLANITGINLISLDLEDPSEKKAKETIRFIEAYLKSNTDFKAFTELPGIRTEGDYPGKDTFEDIMSFFYVLAFMTMFCSLFLISNTMHTIIIEQRKEIAQMKAVGATKYQVMRSYLRTNIIMGLTGSILGAAMGILIAYVVGIFLLDSFFGLTLAFDVYLPVVLFSILIGLTIIIVAGLPALLMSLRTTVRKGMEDRGMTNGFARTMFNKPLMKMFFIPRNAKMSVRNISRNKGRSISTTVQVAIAVGMFIGLVAIGYTSSNGMENIYDDFGSDIETHGQITGGNPLTEDVQGLIDGIDGVERVAPFLASQGFLEGIEFNIYGHPHDTFVYRHERTVSKGRWFDHDECSGKCDVIVLNRFLARDAGKEIGDKIDIELATGIQSFEVIGLEDGFSDWGRGAYVPLETLQERLLLGDIVSGFGILTTTGDHEQIDMVSTEIEDTMLSNGYIVNNYIPYLDLESSKQFNQNIINVMIAVGTIIVFVTLIGLMNALTMNVIERTKEIGMLRCLGSSSWSIRSIFGGEGLVLALSGWIIGIPLGYATAVFLNYMSLKLMNVDSPLIFPVHVVLIAGIMTLVLTVVVIQPPLWRATQLRPGDALRYE
ncbi:MAG: FtsX-like permease family protein [Thermoplasmatota archaeon]